MESSAARASLPERRFAEVGSNRRGKGTMRHLPTGQSEAHPVPDFAWDRVGVGPARNTLQLRKHLPAGEILQAVGTHVSKKSPLILGAEDVQIPRVSVPALGHSIDSAQDAQTQQQLRYIVDEAAARRRVVDPTLAGPSHPNARTRRWPRDGSRTVRFDHWARRRSRRARTSHGSACRTVRDHPARLRSDYVDRASTDRVRAAAA